MQYGFVLNNMFLNFIVVKNIMLPSPYWLIFLENQFV